MFSYISRVLRSFFAAQIDHVHRDQSEDSEGHAERDGEGVVLLIFGGHGVVASLRDQRRARVIKVADVRAGDRADTLAVAELGVGSLDGGLVSS